MPEIRRKYHAMQLDGPGQLLHLVERDMPVPGPGEMLVKILACGVCRTDLHILDGEIPDVSYPIVPGHEIIGRVVEIGDAVSGFAIGDRIGVPWLGSSCGHCSYCLADHENLCDQPQFTGCTRDGGYASHVLASAQYCFAIPQRFSHVEAAPLMCAGLIGWRALRMAGRAKTIGFYGFGAAAHILAQIAVWQGRSIYAFTKPGDLSGQRFARELGCIWADGSDECPPAELDAAIIFAPVGALVPAALRAVRKGGRVICAGIHMSDIPAFPYADLWGERAIMSVANLTRVDGTEFLAAVDRSGIVPTVESFPLAEANDVLEKLRYGLLKDAAVLLPEYQVTRSKSN
ncbi:zinc-dependent alcohol dehydrogenase family protein [Parasphingorhabdus sp.]|uniref:zinc-dependent alcohol dehydrogenase family protein n=1 Tax=Parasphingorhabdus sp. TaxID=2709688 RepID=UPI00359339E2